MVRSTALRSYQERKPKHRNVLMVRKRETGNLGPEEVVEMTMNAPSFSFPRVCDPLNTSQDFEGYWAPLHLLVMSTSSGAKAAWRTE